MEPLNVDPGFWQLLRQELDEWTTYGSRACIETATSDYALLLSRNRGIEESVSRLRAENSRLRKEKVDVVQENTTIKQEAHRDRIQAEARLQGDLREAKQRNEKLSAEVTKLTKMLAEVSNERDGLQQHKKHLEKRVEELIGLKKQLKEELDDMHEALKGEHDARVAATEELQARLAAKEKAEEEREEAVSKFLSLEKQYLAKVTETARVREDANAEYKKYKEMQQQLEAEKELWEEQSGIPKPPVAPLPRAAFQLGSVFGSFRNALVAGAASQMRSGNGEAPPRLGAHLEGQEPRDCRLPEVAARQHDKVHGGGCNDVRFSASGVWMASCGDDGVVRMWTACDASLSTEMKSGISSVGINSVAFCDEKKLIMGASNDRSIKVWDMHTAKQCMVMTGHERAVTCVVQHPTSPNTVATCGEDRVIKLWDLSRGRCQRTILYKSKPLWVAFSYDGNCLVSAHFDGSLQACDAISGAQMAHLDKLHSSCCVAVVPTSANTMVSVGRDGVVCVSDFYRGSALPKRFLHPDILHIGQKRCTPAVAPDNSVIAVGSSSGLLLLLNMQSGELLSKLSCHTSAITAVAWNAQSMDSDVVCASCDRAGTIVFWNAAAPLPERVS
jgi:hypothetical protein